MNDNMLLPPPAPDEDDFTPATLRAELLGGQTRDRAAIRIDFCQRHAKDDPNRPPGPLRHFVHRRRLFALQLWLLLVCLASGDPWDREMPNSNWAMLLDDTSAGADSKVSRSWAWLRDDLGLITTHRHGRNLVVTRCHEFGNAPYTRPKGRFFFFPFAYFIDEWHARLSLTGTAALLIALSRSAHSPWFEFRAEYAPQWLGISADTVRRGFDELQDAGLLQVHQRRTRDLRARYGTVLVNHYALLGPFMSPRATEELS